MGHFGIRVEVSGARALFSRPELKVERVSYDVITPSAARGLLEAVFWHPGMRYVIDRIHILNPIRFTNVRRNEVKSKASSSLLKTAITQKGPLPFINVRDDIQQRASLILTDVHYVIEAHFDMTEKAKPDDNPGKFIEMLHRRLRKGQCFHQPYLGVREFPAKVKPYEEADQPRGFYNNDAERDFGLMLYDMDYSNPRNITPMFFRAVMRHGVIDVAESEVLQ